MTDGLLYSQLEFIQVKYENFIWRMKKIRAGSERQIESAESQKTRAPKITLPQNDQLGKGTPKMTS